MNIGDLVMTPKGVARITKASVYDCETTRGCYEPRYIHLLTAAEAFEIAKCPVPEGAKIHWDPDSEWWYSTDKVWSNWSHKGWSQVREQESYGPVDLRRTPVSDTWDTLPQVVREKVEEALRA